MRYAKRKYTLAGEYRRERLQLEVADGSPGATDFIGPAGLRPAGAWGRRLDG
jgi:hypothetical protein